MSALLADLKFAARTLLKTPSFTAVAILTLALGIGANTTIFSAVHAALLRPLPYKDPSSIVAVRETPRTDPAFGIGSSYPSFLDWRSQSQTLGPMGAYSRREFVFHAKDDRITLLGAFASPDLFSVLGVPLIKGRPFAADEDRPGAPPVVLIGNAFWQSRLGGDRDILGKSIRLDDEDFTVIGILSSGFEFPRGAELWVPLGRLAGRPQYQHRAVHLTHVLARLRPGHTLEQAQSEMLTINDAIHREHPTQGENDHSVGVVSLREQLVGDLRLSLLVLLGAVGFVLLIACANVANLLLARAAARRKEFAVRTALGATGWRLARQLLAESLLLSFLGGSLGILLSFWGLEILSSTGPDARISNLHLDLPVFIFTFAACIITGLLFGLAPALQARRTAVIESLKQSGSLGHVATRGRLRSALVVAQVALSLVLLAGAGLLLRSYSQVLKVDPGFRAENLLTLQVILPGTQYQDAQRVLAFFDQLQQDLEALPGVRAATAVNSLPVSGGDSYGTIAIEGRPPEPGDAPPASFRRILPNYFRALGIPLLQGREFSARDTGKDEMVVIISESFARHFWPTENPIGKRIRIGPPEIEPLLTVVGVVGNVHNVRLDAEPFFASYEPLAQRPRLAMRVLVRTVGPPAAAIPSVRNSIRALEKDTIVQSVATMDDRLALSLGERRFRAGLLLSMAALALVLAAVGIYGVISWSVAQRTREFGIRRALGAQAGDIFRLVGREGLRLVFLGIVIGLAGSFALTRFLQTVLFGVTATDPFTFLSVSILFTLVAFLACWFPARRATRTDPLTALRYE